MFHVWGRVAETGSGNKWLLVVFKSARLEQLGDMLTFYKGLIFVFYGTASLSHCHWPCSTCGVPSRKTGSGNKSRLVAFESTRMGQRRGVLTFDKIMKFVVYYPANFPH